MLGSRMSVCWLGALIFFAGVVAAQDYPARPIRMVADAPGGGTDFVGRIVARGLTQGLGQQVIVDNRGGATVAPQIVMRAPADGYTVLYYGNSVWTQPFFEKTPYDPVRDFVPITLSVRLPNILAVHPALPVKSVPELIALAKAKPGALNGGGGIAGSAGVLALQLFKAMAGVNIVDVPYAGAAAGLNALVANEVQLAFGVAGVFMPQVKAGRLRALAVTSAQPSALLPGLPTVAASVPGYESVSYNAMLAPAGTPAAIISRLNQETVRFLNRPETRELLLNAGIEVVASSPEDCAATIKSDMAKIAKLIKDAGLRTQ